MCGSAGGLSWQVASVLWAVLGTRQATSLLAVTEFVCALLLGQSLHPADLMRYLPHPQTTKARQGFRRVHRLWERTVLSSEVLTPRLVRAVLALVQDAEITLVLDSTRCIRWEIFTLGVRVQGRVLLVAWSVLAYPWPKRQFTPTVLALLERTFAVWPVQRPVHLVADRGFPSLPLFALVQTWSQRLPLTYTIRLRAGDYVQRDDGQKVCLRDVLHTLQVQEGHTYTARATYQRGTKTATWLLLVITRGLPVVPVHQRGPADRARARARAERRTAHLRSKKQRQAALSDRVWILLTTAATAAEATAWYAQRFATEGTYRDLKTWDLEAVLARVTRAQQVAAVMGLAVLTAFLQAAIGAAAGRSADPAVRPRQLLWTTTDRLSPFWRGRQVLHEPAPVWRPWLKQTLDSLATDLQHPGPAHREAA